MYVVYHIPQIFVPQNLHVHVDVYLFEIPLSNVIIIHVITHSCTCRCFLIFSVTGKKLMAKCRTLLQENQDLGKQISQGRVAQLEAEISMQKKYCQELKSSSEGKLHLPNHTCSVHSKSILE